MPTPTFTPATTLAQIVPGQSFRVAGANVRMRVNAIDVGSHAATVRVTNLDTGIGYVYCWENSTPVYNVAPSRDLVAA